MRRAILALAALAAAAAIAQPVAKLDPKPPSQHDRIEQKLDQVLELLRAPEKPPAPPPTVPKPADPAPQPPPADSRFTAWCAQGLSLVDIAVWKLGRGLTPAEVELAYASGCPRPGASPGGAPGAGAGPAVDPSGFELGTGGGNVKRNAVFANVEYSFSFTVSPGTKRVRLDSFGSPGQFFEHVTERVTKITGEVVHAGIPGRMAPYVSTVLLFDLPPGRYRYFIKVDRAGTLGTQYQQWDR